ncbi:MAG: hypothetical protein U1F43_22215 [Myxococcota bacterium]
MPGGVGQAQPQPGRVAARAQRHEQRVRTGRERERQLDLIGHGAGEPAGAPDQRAVDRHGHVAARAEAQDRRVPGRAREADRADGVHHLIAIGRDPGIERHEAPRPEDGRLPDALAVVGIGRLAQRRAPRVEDGARPRGRIGVGVDVGHDEPAVAEEAERARVRRDLEGQVLEARAGGEERRVEPAQPGQRVGLLTRREGVHRRQERQEARDAVGPTRRRGDPRQRRAHVGGRQRDRRVRR